jgi:arsenate reductase-like glutaredoxin family protein
MSDAQLLALLSQEPTLARRPLLISDHGAVSGFSAVDYERLAALG